MTDSLTILVLIATFEAHSPVISAATSAGREALGADQAVVVQSFDPPISDQEMVRLGRARQARVVAVVSWGSDRERIRIHAFRSDTNAWFDQELRFGPGDAVVERGRTVGFTLASLVSEPRPPKAQENAEMSLPAPAGSGTSPQEVAPPATQAREAPMPRSADPAPSEVLDAVETVSPTFRAPRTDWHGELDLRALAAYAPWGYGGGLGGTVTVQYYVSRYLGISVEGGGRTAQVPPAQASSRVVWAGAGISVRIPLSRTLIFGSSARLLGILHTLERPSEREQEPAQRVRPLPGADLSGEVGFRFSDSLALVLAGGAECALGTTEVLVKNRAVAKIEPFRVFTSGGLRIYY